MLLAVVGHEVDASKVVVGLTIEHAGEKNDADGGHAYREPGSFVQDERRDREVAVFPEQADGFVAATRSLAYFCLWKASTTSVGMRPRSETS